MATSASDTAVVIADLKGASVSPDEYDLLRHPKLGGIILFSRNYQNPEQLKSLCADISRIGNQNLLIAVDQEGGRIQRFSDGFSALPAASKLGEIYSNNQDLAISLANDTGFVMASELRLHGVDLSFAPVLDLDFGVSDVIGSRSFHRDPDAVIRLAGAYIKGMHDAGMAAVAKHFPGHGAVTADSHLETPVDERSLEEIERQDLAPFDKLLKNECEGVMTAHIHYPAVDSLVPTFSKSWIHNILRKRMDFQGFVFSDDLVMAGAAVGGSPLQRATLALDAGCDALLICNDPEAARDVLDNLDTPTATRSLKSMKAHQRAGEIPGFDEQRLDLARKRLSAMVAEP